MIAAGDILVIAAVVLVLFGASAIPKFARSLGQAKAEFEKGIQESKTKTARQNDKKKGSSKKKPSKKR